MLRNIMHLLSGESGRLLLRLVEAQEDFFQRRLVCRNICRVMLAGDVNDLRQVTLDAQVQSALIRALSHVGYAYDLLEPGSLGWASKSDLHIVLVDLFKRGHVIDLDQSSLANDGDAVAGALDFRQHVRGEEDGASLSMYLGGHAIEFLLVERVQARGRFVEDKQPWLMHEGLHQPQLLFVATRIFA